MERRACAYLGSGTGAPNHNAPPARGLGPERQAVPDLDVLLQDQAAAEGALPLHAVPGGSGRVGAGLQREASPEGGSQGQGGGVTCTGTHA